MRIISITLASLIAVGTLIFMTRIWGLSQAFTPYEHVFFDGKVPFVVVKANTLDLAKEVLKTQPDAILWIDVRLSKDKVPFVLPANRDTEFLDMKKRLQEASPNIPIMTGIKLSEYNWEEINEFYKDTPAVKEYYEQFPTTRFILNIVDNAQEVHTALVSAIEGFKPDSRTLIQSDTLIIIKTIRELKPGWVYGTSTPDLMRFLTLDAMWILPSTQFIGDVFIAPFTLMKRPAFNDDIITEMRRRHKRIFLVVENEKQLAEARRYNAEGLIVNELSELPKLLDQGPVQ